MNSWAGLDVRDQLNVVGGLVLLRQGERQVAERDSDGGAAAQKKRPAGGLPLGVLVDGDLLRGDILHVVGIDELEARGDDGGSGFEGIEVERAANVLRVLLKDMVSLKRVADATWISGITRAVATIVD